MTLFVVFSIWVIIGLFSIINLRINFKKNKDSRPNKEILSVKIFSFIFFIIGVVGLIKLNISINIKTSQSKKVNSKQQDKVSLLTDKYVKSLVHNNGVGASVAIVNKNKDYIFHYGRVDIKNQSSPNNHTLYEIGSITKVFTGILLSDSIHRGDITLSDNFLMTIPSISEMKNGNEITYRNLVTHTSGLPRLPPNIISFNFFIDILFGENPYRSYSDKDLKDSFRDIHIESPLGHSVLYSNYGFGILGYSLCNFYKLDYSSLIEERICLPLGMKNTTVNVLNNNKNFSKGYQDLVRIGFMEVGLESKKWNLPATLVGAGGLRSTIQDMLLFLKANMGKLNSSKLIPILQNSHIPIFKENNFRQVGMGWQLSYKSDLKQWVIWHNGGTGGYRSFIGFSENKKSGVVILSNSKVNFDHAGFSILQKLLNEI